MPCVRAAASGMGKRTGCAQWQKPWAGVSHQEEGPQGCALLKVRKINEGGLQREKTLLCLLPKTFSLSTLILNEMLTLVTSLIPALKSPVKTGNLLSNIHYV